MILGFASWSEVAYKVRADDLDHERAKKDAQFRGGGAYSSAEGHRLLPMLA
ncbi:hypothetical protein [Pseudomonas sp. Z2-11]